MHVDIYYDLSETPAVSFVYGGHVISVSGFLFYGDHATYISIIPFYGGRENSAAGILFWWPRISNAVCFFKELMRFMLLV